MFVAAVWTLGWFLLITAVAIAAIAALGVFLVGVFFIRVMAKNRGKSMDVRKIDNDTVRKAGALTAEVEGDFVVFLIGAGVNNWWNFLTGQIPVPGKTMGAMINELEKMPSEDTGFLGGTAWLGNPTIMVQYWRSMEHLHAWARKPQGKHQSIWGRFNRYLSEADRGMHDDGGMGIWHEAYLVKDGNYEAIYNLMPPLGLGRVGRLVPAHGKTGNAAGRIAANQDRTAAKGCPVGAADESSSKPAPSACPAVQAR